MESEIKKLLDTRAMTHGNWDDVSELSQEIKTIFSGQLEWMTMDPQYREALEMIAVKIARIIKGDPGVTDHWADIAGYATLVSGEYVNEPKTGDENDAGTSKRMRQTDRQTDILFEYHQLTTFCITILLINNATLLIC